MAEVLITLGIIGVVSAMTIPNLIASHKRHVIEVRLAKFYSIMSQAVKMADQDLGGIVYYMPKRTDSAFEWYKEYLDKYIENVKEKRFSNNAIITLNDGSGFYSYVDAIGASDPTRIIYTFCPYAKDCMQAPRFDGKKAFLFILCQNGKFVTSNYCSGQMPSRASLLSACSTSDENNRHACTALIQLDGWKVKKDYPWIK